MLMPRPSPSPTPFSFYEGPRAKAGGPEAQYYHQLFLSDPMQPKSKSQTSFLSFFPWLDVGLCDFLQWPPTEWRVMFQISGRDFLLPSQMDLKDHSTTLNNISKISEVAKQISYRKNPPWNKTKHVRAHITQVHSTKDLDRLGQIKCQEKPTPLEC